MKRTGRPLAKLFFFVVAALAAVCGSFTYLSEGVAEEVAKEQKVELTFKKDILPILSGKMLSAS